nr:hypothetical protein [Tanacetum cinerariifolium]
LGAAGSFGRDAASRAARDAGPGCQPLAAPRARPAPRTNAGCLSLRRQQLLA